jgi:LPS-assembly protein
MNVAYRFDRGTTIENRYETTDLSFRMPVSNEVEVVGRWLYSFDSDETADAFAGIEFGQCCWKLRVLGRHFKNRAGSTGSTSVMVQLELAGLGAFGSSVDSFLQREVYGYQVD